MAFQLEQAVGLALVEPLQRDAGHRCDDLADQMLVYRPAQLLGLLLVLAFEVGEILLLALGAVAELGGLLVVLVEDGFRLLPLKLLDLGLQLLVGGSA